MFIYKRIKDMRIDNDLTQEQIAKKLNLHLTTYRRYESGESELPLHIFKELCKIYNTSADFMLEFTNQYKTLPKK